MIICLPEIVETELALTKLLQKWKGAIYSPAHIVDKSICVALSCVCLYM